jgi:hypothetical protein
LSFMFAEIDGRTAEAKRASEKAVSCAPAAFDMYLRKRAPWFRPEDHWSRVCARLAGRLEAALRSIAAPQSGLPMIYTRMTVMGQTRKCPCLHGTSVVPSILLQKSFLGGERNFLGPLMHFVCGDVRDLIVSHQTDHGPAHRRYRVLQLWRCLNALAKFSASFDFRLLQHNPLKCGRRQAAPAYVAGLGQCNVGWWHQPHGMAKCLKLA